MFGVMSAFVMTDVGPTCGRSESYIESYLADLVSHKTDSMLPTSRRLIFSADPLHVAHVSLSAQAVFHRLS